jgi:phosphoenolpyruvate carboxylase
VFPAVYRRLDDWLQGDAAGIKAPVVRPFARLGTWIGGDRDGNPNVTPDVTRGAAAIASEHILIALEAAARRTGDALTHDGSGTPASPELLTLSQDQRELLETSTTQVGGHSQNEPHRRALLVVAERISATRRSDADLAYANSDQLEADLAVVQRSLLDAGAPRAAYGDLQQLIWQVQTFGFHLAELEVRQHSHVHDAALMEIAEHGIDGPLSTTTHDVLDTFRAIGAVQRRHGARAAQRYVVSFTRSARHVAAVYELATLVFPDPTRAPVIDVVPLFETSVDLEASVDILEGMLALPAVQRGRACTGGGFESCSATPTPPRMSAPLLQRSCSTSHRAGSRDGPGPTTSP